MFLILCQTVKLKESLSKTDDGLEGGVDAARLALETNLMKQGGR